MVVFFRILRFYPVTMSHGLPKPNLTRFKLHVLGHIPVLSA
jgi:hypothetical protein